MQFTKFVKHVEDTPPYMIAGGGPAGLTLAWMLAHRCKRRCLIVEKTDQLGGCHRVDRVNGLFVEHGPRIYLDSYLNFQTILTEMGLKWSDIFTEYKYSYSQSGLDLIKHLTWRELYWLVHIHILYWFSEPQMQTVLQFLTEHDFSAKAIDIIDSYCRLTDGAGVDRYTMKEFTQLINQNFFATIYQPRLPNDEGLFKWWERALLDTGLVTIWKSAEVISFNASSSKIDKVLVMREGSLTVVPVSGCFLAIPPVNLIPILKQSSSPDAFGPYDKLVKWAAESKYLDYISMDIHWDRDIKLPDKWTFPTGPWKIGYIVMSDYIRFTDSRSKTVITAVVSNLNAPMRLTRTTSSLDNTKTANQCNETELKDTVLNELRNILGHFPSPYAIILSPRVSKQGGWTTTDTGFVHTLAGFLKSQRSSKYKNLYNVGTQGGKSTYSFTSLESAVSNAMSLVNDLTRPPPPPINTPEYKEWLLIPPLYEMKSVITVAEHLQSVLFFALVIIVILLAFKGLFLK